MPEEDTLDETVIYGNFVEIRSVDVAIEDWTGLPITEYSKKFESKNNMQLYIDDILASFNNRSLVQHDIVQETIDKLGGYNNGKLEFDDNAIESLLQITIEWLGIINSNFNNLLGLVSANNYLSVIEVLNTNMLEDIT